MKNILVFMFIGIFGFGYCQHAEIDSLKVILQESEDDYRRAMVLYDLCEILTKDNIKDQNRNFFFEFNKVAISCKIDSLVIDSFLALSTMYLVENKVDSSHFFLDSAEYYSIKTCDTIHLISCFTQKTSLYDIQEEYDKEDSVVKKGEELFFKYKRNIKEIGEFYSIYAKYLFNRGLLEKSIEYYKKALMINEDVQDISIELGCLYGICWIKIKFKEYDQAEKYALSALKKIKGANAMYKYWFYSSLGQIYIFKSDLDKAVLYQKKALEFSKKNSSNEALFDTYIKLSNIYYRRGEFQLSLKQAEKAIAVSERVKNKLFYNIAKRLELLTLSKLNKLHEIKKQIYKVEKDALEIENFPDYLKVEYYQNMLVCFERIEDYKRALFYSKKLIILNDSINNIAFNNQTLANIEKYESLAKEKEIANLSSQLEIKRAKEQKKLWFVTSVILLFFILIAIVIVGVKKLKKKLKSKDKIISLSEAERDKLRSQQKKSKETFKKIRPYLSNGLKMEVGERINESQQSDYWEDFIAIFESEYPEFLDNLVFQYPNLSKKEIRIAQLVKANFSRKEMTVVLNSTPDSIRQSIFRLRKKLNIDTSEKLMKFFEEF